MAKLSIVAGATSQSVNVFVQNSSVTTGAGLTGLVFNSGSLIAYYTFTGANATATVISLVTLAAVNSAYSSGGFKEIDATHMPGVYRLDIPNTALAAASGQSVVIMLSGATNMAPVLLEIELTATNNQDGVHFGLTGIPNAAAGASGGLHINGSNSGTTTYAALTVTGALTVSDGITVTRSSANTNGLNITGNGTGSGAVITSGSGATGDGVQMTCNSTNGNGLKLTKVGTGKDLNAQTTNSLQVNTTQYNSQTAVTDGNNFPSVNVVDIAGAIVNTATAQIGTNVVSVAAAASNIKKNTALSNFMFLMTDSTTHAPKTGVTVTATRAIDGAAFASCANSVSELANGWYVINLANTDLNGNNIALRFTGTGSDDRDISIITQP